MNSYGLNIIFRMGCICTKEVVTVNDRQYYVRSRLGEGAFSIVDLVEDTGTHKTYALKRITCHSQDDQKVALTEVEFHQVLKHPNILDCIDSALVGKADLMHNNTSEVLIVLPYLPRGTLQDELLKREKAGDHLLQSFLLNMFLQICEGVQIMHETKPYPLAHRDLKTANILLTDDFTPVIMDLGSMTKARLYIQNSHEGRQLQDLAAERSSMPYRAPELFSVDSHSSIDERTDIWSLGCVLYALCFFKSPFDAVYERSDSVALAVVSGNIPIPENSPYSQEVHDLILSLLRVVPQERPFIQEVIEKTADLLTRADNRV